MAVSAFYPNRHGKDTDMKRNGNRHTHTSFRKVVAKPPSRRGAVTPRRPSTVFYHIRPRKSTLPQRYQAPFRKRGCRAQRGGGFSPPFKTPKVNVALEPAPIQSSSSKSLPPLRVEGFFMPRSTPPAPPTRRNAAGGRSARCSPRAPCPGGPPGRRGGPYPGRRRWPGGGRVR